MKREILFRGKTIDGIWCFGDLIHIGGGALIYHGDNQELETIPQEDSPCAVGFYPNEISIVIPETVGQFTGLTDKNGKPIIEGDVLNSFGTQACYTYVISYENGCFIAAHTKIKAYDHKPLKWGSVNRFNELSIEIEVIGNIHDNPELS